jgi:universal stress protein E
MAAVKPARRIVIAIDFSPRAHRLLRYGAELARMTGGDVSVLHVIPGLAAETPDDVAWHELAIKTTKDEAACAGLDPSTPVHVLRGGVAAEVGRFASAHDADLLIIAGRTKPGWNGSLLGSTAETILRHARVPVLLVPSGGRAGAA